jgi:hypothetical protein
MDRESTGSSNKCFDAELTRPTRSHGDQLTARLLIPEGEQITVCFSPLFHSADDG